MRRLVIVVALVPLGLAGCLEQGDPVGAAKAARAGHACPPGQFVNAFDADGTPLCAAPGGVSFACPEGAFLAAVDAGGAATCARPGGDAAPEGLRVAGVYGMRPGGEEALVELRVNVELPPGARAVDLSRLVVRVAPEGSTPLSFLFGAAGDAASTPPRFGVACLRGACSASEPLLRGGDLAEVRVPLPDDARLPPRRQVMLSLVPGEGEAVRADFKTPATYGGDAVVTLR